MSGYDVIGDIHGHVDRLRRLLKLMGYKNDGGFWQHPEGRTVIFVGDLIDRGPGQLETLRLVRAMTEERSAERPINGKRSSELLELELIECRQPEAHTDWWRGGPAERERSRSCILVYANGDQSANLPDRCVYLRS